MWIGPSPGLLRAAVAALVLGPQGAGAQTFTVSAEVVAGCAVVGGATGSLGPGVLNYGAYPAVHAGQITAAATTNGGAPLRVECTPGLELQVSVDGGQHAAGGQRRLGLEGGAAFVAYGLFTSAAFNTPVPVGTSVSVEVPPSGLLDLPVYGLATLPGVGLFPGIYSDTLQVTLTW